MEMATAHKSGLSSLRGEVTVLRKEVVVNTSSLRVLIKKTNDIAVSTDRLAASLITQRHILLKVSTELATAMARRQAPSGVASQQVTCGADGSRTAPAVAVTAPAPISTEEEENQEARWVLDLKRDLDVWLLRTFLNATCTADIWVSTTDVNLFLREWVVRRFQLSPREAVRMLEKRWRLPVRPKRRASLRAAPAGAAATAASPGTSSARARAVSSSKDWTPAYRYLHRGISHLYQRVGAKAVSAFASHVNEKLSKGTLRRLRGTKTKYEVFFDRRDSNKLLQNNFFLTNNTCRHGLVRALAAVFSFYNVVDRFSESGETRDDPRVVACRLGYFALVSTKVRAHLRTRAAANHRGADEQVNEEAVGNDDEGEECNDQGGQGGGNEESDGDDVGMRAAGNFATSEPLNGGHRPEWEAELPIVDGILRPQGAYAVNGFRVTDALDATRLDTTRPPPTPARPLAGAPHAAAAGTGDTGASGTMAENAAAGGLAGAADGQRVGAPPPLDESDADVWLSGEDEEDPPRQTRRTNVEAREAASRRAAARVLMESSD